MPKVPVSDNVVLFSGAPAGPMPSETDFAMAAAAMHAQGRLFEGDSVKNVPIRYGPKDEDVVNFKQSDYMAGTDERQRRLMDPKRKPDLKAPELTPDEAEDVPGRKII